MPQPPRPDASHLRHRRPVQPLFFPDCEPEDERVPEGKRHLELRTFLYQVLKRTFAEQHGIGCDQFVYWNARDPLRRCAPDVFVKLGRADDLFPSWKTWERGTPELVVEIEGEASGKRLPWPERLERFYELGAREVVRFDPEAASASRLRVWDRLEDDLVERLVEGDATPCVTLGLWWVVGEVEGIPAGLRLARDREGTDVLLSPSERLAQLEERAPVAR